MEQIYLKTISNELKAEISKFTEKGNKEWRKKMFTPCLPNRQTVLVKYADGRTVCERNPDFGVDKLIEKMLPLVNGDRELAKELIVKEHRKNPDIDFQELLSLVQGKLKSKQSAMTTGMREQYVPRRTFKHETPKVVEERSQMDRLWEEKQRLANLYAARIKQALHDYAAYDLRKVSKEGPNGTHIIYEGQKTIAGKSVDIDEQGNVLVKIALEYIPNIPKSVKQMIDRWFKPYTPQRAKAYEIAASILKKNPNASLDEIGIAIKESFR